MKRIRYFLEYLLVKGWLLLMKFLPLEKASDLASVLFKTIGMKLKVTKTAYNNIKMIFPNMSDLEINQMILDVWDNFGRVVAETPIFFNMKNKELSKYINITGLEHLNKLKGKRAMYFTAHLANWEVAGRGLILNGIKFNAVYRAANNKLVDSLINNLRANDNILSLIPKGKSGAKQIIAALKRDEHVVMLIDQKMNDGINIPFMGKDAMTAPAIAHLALKYDCPLIPIRQIRKDKYHFDLIIEEPLKYNEPNVESIMLQINEIVGNWVKEYPGQWFWLHKRWITDK